MRQPILRKEIVSNQMQPSEQLIRVVKTKDGEIFIDSSKKANGRGVYINPSLDAIKIAQQKKLLERNLKVKVPSEIYQQLEEEVRNNWD